ncbi:MAG TPA: DMT family transporter [Microvirga sp.]|nr:DMT family transporter [Microvirga sp.]
MPNDALLAVLLGALLHASWNAAIKSGRDKFLDTVLVAGGAGVIAAAGLPFLPLPAPESIPYLLMSSVLQLIYFLLVAAAYRTGDMSYAYPLMRGTAVLLVASASSLLIGEHLTARAWIGILSISAGVLALTLLYRRSAPSLAPTAFALGNAAIIASYTLVDGVGARLSGQSVAYTLWLSLLTAVPLLAWTAWNRPAALAGYFKIRWMVGLGGGFCTLASYGLALWAMTRAPVATTAALRETSILFGMLISAGFLKERVGLPRMAAGIVIALGAAALRLPG